MNELKKLRDRIDWLDGQIAGLLNERMRATDQVGKIKRVMQHDVADHTREMRVLSGLETIIQHPVLKANISNIYREIMQESKTCQQFFLHQTVPFSHIGMIGMGLMGGSICKGLKTKNPAIQIGTLLYESDDLAMAQEGGWCDQVYPTLQDLIHNCEVIILATPISTIIPLAQEIAQCTHHKKLIVVDIASVKGEIVEVFKKLSGGNIEYVSTHPMAGKEKAGFANSGATLFVNRPWLVIPHENNSIHGIESIKELILFLGSHPLNLEASLHDSQTALISHLPSILAKAYFDFVSSIDAESLQVAGPGFQTFTRLAHDNPEMRVEISEHNQQAIQFYLKQWMEFLTRGVA